MRVNWKSNTKNRISSTHQKQITMKYLSTILALLFVSSLYAQTSLSGKITDSETGEELIAANVVLYKGEILITGVATDFEGDYHINIDPGTYDVMVEYVGYLKSKTNGVIVRAGQKNTFDVPLSTGVILEEIVVSDSKIRTKRNDTAMKSTVTNEEIRTAAKKTITSVAAEAA
ncbi:MAG: hypothetical protein ACI8YQ_004487, partial [Polaribacter sp.]